LQDKELKKQAAQRAQQLEREQHNQLKLLLKQQEELLNLQKK
jgi:hypothetical protein